MPLRAAAATRDISPTKPMALYGYPHVERIHTGIHDPLLASVIVLELENERFALISLDVLMLEPQTARNIRDKIAVHTHAGAENVFISCTHTHSGPVTTRLIPWQNDRTIPPPDPEYLGDLCEQTVDAAVSTLAHLEPAELQWTTADASGVGSNRLSVDGVTDPECGVLAVRAAGSDRMIGVATIYGMHPTVLHEDSTLVSSDFPHYTRLAIREQFGKDLPVVYHNAPCGNQSPRYCVQGQTFAEAERLGRKLGDAVCNALADLAGDSWDDNPKLAAVMTEVELPRRKLLPVAEAEEQLREYRETYDRLKEKGAPRPEVRTAECAIFGAEGMVALARAEARGEIENRLSRDYLPIDVQALRIGNTCLAGLPGECFTEYALEIKQRAAARTFVVSLVNGELQGYVVTPKAVGEGGYEAANAVFAPESGALLVHTALQLIEELNHD